MIESQKIKEGYFQNLTCASHQNIPITFVCISHTDCMKNNLLCMECIDEFNSQSSHHLISLRKFSKYIRSYQNQVSNSLPKAKQNFQNLRNLINTKLDEIQSILIGQTQQQVLQNIPITSHEKTKMIAKRQIWSRVQKKRKQPQQMQKQIKLQIEEQQRYTLQALNQLFNLSKSCFDKLSNPQKIQPNNQNNQNNQHISKNQQPNGVRTRMKKKDIAVKHLNQGQSNQMIQQQQQSSLESITQKMINPRNKRKNRYKRYSLDEKIKILSELKNITDKKILAKKYRISTSTILRWQKSFQSQIKMLNKLSKTNKKQSQINDKVIKDQYAL